jgi:hypothetical protein
MLAVTTLSLSSARLPTLAFLPPDSAEERPDDTSASIVSHDRYEIYLVEQL